MLDSCNICTLSSMKIISALVQKYQVPVKITFNSLYYTKEQYPMLLDLMNQLIALGLNTFIVADPALIIHLREKGINCKIHLSGETALINRFTVRFFNRFQISRYIFPGKTSVAEMKSCIENCGQAGIEYEAFILNDWRPFAGAFCGTIHCDEMPNSCHILYRNVGVTHLKVVGRGYSLECLTQDLRNLKKVIEMARTADNAEDFSRTVQREFFQNKCTDKCFYYG